MRRFTITYEGDEWDRDDGECVRYEDAMTAIRAAQIEMRERCAKAALFYAPGHTGETIVDAIRKLEI